MSSLLKLTVDRQNSQLVALNGSVISLPPLFQSNAVTLQVQVVDPTGGFPAQYSVVDLAAYGLRAAIGDTPTGASGGPTPLALQDTFAWNSVGKYFSAQLALNTSGVDSFIGTAAAKQAYFELNLTLSGNRTTILQSTVILRAVVDELASLVPTPEDEYLTKAEVLALLAAKQSKVIQSPGGIYGREIGIEDDGTPTDNIFQL